MKFWGVFFLSLPFLLASSNLNAGCNGFCGGGQPMMMSVCGPGGCSSAGGVCGPSGCSPTVCRGPSCVQRSFRSVSEEDNKPGVQIGIRQDLDRAFSDNTYWTPSLDGSTPSKHIRLDNKGWAVFLENGRTLRKVAMEGDQIVVRNGQGQFVPLSQVSPEALSELQQFQTSRNPQTASVPAASASPNFDFLDNIQGSGETTNPAVASSHATQGAVDSSSSRPVAEPARPASPPVKEAVEETNAEPVAQKPPLKKGKFEIATMKEYLDLREAASAGDVVILNFGADYCGPCRGLQPTLDTLGRNETILHVNIEHKNREGVAEIPNYFASEPINRSVEKIPRTLILKRHSDGMYRIMDDFTGPENLSQLQRRVQTVRNKPLR